MCLLLRLCIILVMSSSLSSSPSRRWYPSSLDNSWHHQNRFYKSSPRVPKSLRRPSVFRTNYNLSGPQRHHRPRVIHHFDFEKFPVKGYRDNGASLSYPHKQIYSEKHTLIHGSVKPNHLSRPKSSSRPGSSLPTRPGSSSSQRQLLSGGGSSGGCNTPEGFRSGGSTWQMSGCRRGVCAVTLDGSWKVQEDTCNSLLQNPQYQCVMEEKSRDPFPNCCAGPKECRELGPLPQ